MGTTIGGKEIATDKSDHKAVSPPAVSNIPPMTPPKPDGVPAPFPYVAQSTSASGTASKLTVGGGKAVVEGSGLDVAQPGNQPSQPAPLHDLVTQAVNKKCTVTSGSGKVTAGGKGVSTTTDRAAMNVMSVGSQVAQQTGTLLAGGGADASSADSKSADGNGQTVGEPVSVATGEVVDEVTDLSLPGLIPVEWKRIYASGFCDESTALGRGGWTFSLNQWIEDRGDELVLRRETGRNLHVPKMPVRETRFVRSKRLEITRQLEDAYEVFDLEQRLRRVFRPARAGGRALLRSIRDAWGNEVVLTFDGERLARIVDTAGRELRLEHDNAGRIVAIAVWSRGAEWQRVRYDYSSTGELASAVDPCGNAERYAYDGKHRIVEKTRKNGVRFYYAYDEAGRCTSSWGDGDIHRVDLLYDAQKRTTTTVNTLEPRVFYWNAKGNVTREHTFDKTFAITRTFDEDGFLEAETNAAGETWRFERDARGNLVRCVDPAENVTTYDVRGDLCIGETSSDGHTVTYAHDAQGALVGLTYPWGEAYVLARDVRGRLQGVYSGERCLAWREYDEQHNLVTETDAARATTRFACDALGRPTARADALNRTTIAAYDAMGRVVEFRDATGGRVALERDALGNIVRLTDPLGQITERTFGGTGVLVQHLAPSGHAWHFAYDNFERLVEVRNPKHETHSFRYDRAGHVEREDTFDERRITYHYSTAGRLCRIEYPNDTWRAFQYDRNGHLTGETSPHGSIHFLRDPRGRLVEAVLTEPSGKTVTRFDRDAFGRVVGESLNGRTTRYEYDSQGRRSARVLPDGQRTDYGYDAYGSLTEVRHDGHALTFERDAVGLDRNWSFGNGAATVARSFDAKNRLIAQQAQTSAGVAAQRAWTYDGLDRVARVDDLRWGTTAYAHDPLGQLLEARTSSGRELFDYDAAGSIQRMLRFPGPETPYWSVQTGNLLRNTGEHEFVHDSAGRLVQKADRAGAITRYFWDCRDRLREVRLPDGTRARYTYDAFGRRVRKEIVSEVAPEQPRVVSYLWDGDTIAEEIDSARGARVYVHEPETFVPLLHQENGDTYLCLTDHVGIPTELVSATGEVVWAARHSAWGQVLTTWAARGDVAVDSPFRLLGQYYDEETGLCATRHRYFSPDTGRWLSSDPLGLAGGSNLYSFAKSPVADMDPLGLLPWAWDPDGWGHHLVPRRKATSVGLSLLATTEDTPTFFPKPYRPGDHEELHRYQARTLGDRRGPWNGSAEELITASRKGLEGTGHIRGDLKIPRTGKTLARDVTPRQAFARLMRWHREELAKRSAGCG